VTAAFEPLFLSAGPDRNGQRFCIYHPPQGASVRGAVVYVHPFAEEMNKSRRMAALASRALAAEGMAVLQMDLLGCGDSSGDFADASWADWTQDVLLAAQWLQARHDAPLWLWGLRAGCLVATAAAASLQQPLNLLLWQPSPQGKTVLQQFLRLKAAADLAGGGKGVVEGLKKTLSEGRSVEVAGYELNPALAQPLADATLTCPPTTQRVLWLETSTRAEASLLPASRTTVDRWQATAGVHVQTRVATGPAFWQTTEIEDAPDLVAATTRMVLDEAMA
jgi:exosortase A-associated hydrolase 2